MMPDDDPDLEALRHEKERRAMLDATKRTSVGGGIAGLLSGVASSIAGGQKSIGGLARTAATHALLGAGIGGGSQYIGQSLAGPVDENDGGGHANRGALGGAIAGGIGGLGLAAMLGSGKLGWLKKAAPAAKSLLGEHIFDNIAADKLKSMVAKGEKGRLAAALGIGGAGLGGFSGWEQGVDADYAKSLEDDNQ